MRDLGPFKAKSGHQSTLTEGDSIDILSQVVLFMLAAAPCP